MKSDNSAFFRVLYCFLLLIVLILTIPFNVSAAPVDRVDSSQTLEKLPLPARYAVSAAIGRDRTDYHVQNRDSDITARNAGQSYSVKFSDGGATFQKGAVKWGMSLIEWGYGDELEPAEAVKPHTDKNRVEYRRGNLTEWYVNGPMGLQQGFTIDSAPKNRGKGETLQVRMELKGGLQAKVDSDGRGVSLLDKTGASVFRYGGLTVFDADGKDIPARLTADAGNLAIDVDDRNARYPLTIDPLIETAKLTTSDGAAGDKFGSSISISGDTMVVGAYGDDSSRGSVYVFTYSDGAWAQSAKLTASDGTNNDYFGYSVTISGDTIVVGVPQDDEGDSNTGSVFVFVKPGSAWIDMTETAVLTASDGAMFDQLGYSVSISGDTIVAGTPNNTGNGSAYVFVKPGSAWVDMTQTAKLTAGDGASGDNFGYSVSISGDTIAVGAYGDDSNRGSAYVFAKPGSAWVDMTQTAKLTASDGASNDKFGWSVSIDGDTVVAGANGDDTSLGAAYVFDKPGSVWADMTQTAKLTAGDGVTLDNFGYSVSISGDKIVVGAYGDESFQGAAYAFSYSGGTGIQLAKLTASDGAAGDYFGSAAVISGNAVVVGAHADDSSKGSAYFYSDVTAVKALTVATAGAGTGTVTSSPAMINCPGGICSDKFGSGSDVKLTATPATGSVLDSWTGGCPGNPTDCTVTMDADKTVTATFETDLDDDGISDSSENGGPNGGDGNSDGFLDSTQADVATFKDINGNWVTMVSGGALETITASSNPSPGDIPAGVTPPCGFFGFKITGLVAGGSATLTLVLHNQDTTINDYYKYGPTPTDGTNHWYQFLDDGTTGASISHAGGKTYITLRLKDGGLGDDDLAANGVIVDVGGPMVSAGSGSGGSGSSSGGGGGGGGGCFVSATD